MGKLRTPKRQRMSKPSEMAFNTISVGSSLNWPLRPDQVQPLPKKWEPNKVVE